MNPGHSIPRRHFRLAILLWVLAATLLCFLSQKRNYIFDYSLASYTDYYWPRRLGLITHLTGGLLAITTGLVQIWLGLTHRTSALHRGLGKIYASGVLIGSLGGFYLALTIPAGYLLYSSGLFGLASAWAVTTGMALYSIHKRRLDQHRAWMLRSYTVTFAFVTFRLATHWLHRWIHVAADPVADDIEVFMAWGCWVIPLLIVEPLIRRGFVKPFARTVTSH